MEFGFDGPLWIWGEGDEVDEMIFGDDDDNNFFHRERHQYKMNERIQINCCDDRDFVWRFRISKATFVRVHELVKVEFHFIVFFFAVVVLLGCCCCCYCKTVVQLTTKTDNKQAKQKQSE